MTKPTLADVTQSGMERVASKLELEAALHAFEAAVWRGDAARLNIATTTAQAALQAHLDGIASGIAVARRQAGF